MKVRAVVIDDEQLAVQRVTDLLDEHSWVEVTGIGRDGPSGLDVIKKTSPELIFLDVEMPGFSGVELLRRLENRRPHIVFVTAFEEYAAAAFELRALDYVVKPISARRFGETMTRVLETLGHRGISPAVDLGVEALTRVPVHRIFVRQFGKIIPVSVDEIVRFEAKRDYVALFTVEGRRYYLHVTLAALANQLDQTRFVRVHRSHVVNLDHVVQMDAHDNTRLGLHLKNGDTIVASRSCSKALRKISR